MYTHTHTHTHTHVQPLLEQQILIEVPLLPKLWLALAYSELRPIALMPQLRKMLEHIVSQMGDDELNDHSPWQFACTSGVQVCDLLLCVFLAGARCQEFGLPLILRICDIPKAFDEIRHEFILQTLLESHVHPTLVAYIMRSLMLSVCMLRLGTIKAAPIHPQCGLPQGGKLGPRLHKMCFARALQDTWQECQRRRLGFDLEHIYVPFLWFSDNCIILAHSAWDFMDIVRLLQEALQKAGWRFPDAKVEYQINQHVDAASAANLRAVFKERPPAENMKAVGAYINVRGHTSPDMNFKMGLGRSALHSHQKLWATIGVSRTQAGHDVSSIYFCLCLERGPMADHSETAEQGTGDILSGSSAAFAGASYMGRNGCCIRQAAGVSIQGSPESPAAARCGCLHPEPDL